VKLLDFGIARETRTQLVKDASDEPRELVEERTGSGIVLGSPHHMSPEQAHGDRVDHRSDLWSFGVVLFRALAGKRPFDGEVMTAVMLAVVSKPIPSVREFRPELPSVLDRFFATALNREVARRFDSAMDMAQALEAIAKGESPDRFFLTATDLAVTRPGRGPDDVTLDGSAPKSAVPNASEAVAERSAPSAAEKTGSREFSAVTTGTGQLPRRSSPLRWVLLGAAVLAAGVGLVVFNRPAPPQPSNADRPTETPPAASPPPPTAQTLVTPAPTLVLTATTSVEAPRTVAPSASSAPASTQRSRTTAAPRSKHTIDPFTGLPIP
jgi:serine/threonine protein kinase